MTLCMYMNKLMSNKTQMPGKWNATTWAVTLLLSFFTGSVMAQSDNSENNHVRETVLLIPGVKSVDNLETLPADQKNVTTNYFDGLGRNTQKVSTQGSPAMKDVVQPVIYDAYGRERIKYLPYVSPENNGQYKPGPVGTTTTYNTSAHHAFYTADGDKIADDEKPYAETVFEASPLSDVVKQGAPGAAWQPEGSPTSLTDKTIKKVSALNQELEVLRFTYGGTPVRVGLHASKYYASGRLMVDVTIDEQGYESKTYTDKDGKIILKKVQSDSRNGVAMYACTYYIYDDLGNLMVVLPPEAVTRVETILFPQP